jgi:dolichol kinase
VYGALVTAGACVVAWLWAVLGRKNPLLWVLEFLLAAPNPVHGAAPSLRRIATLAAWGTVIAAFVHAVAWTKTPSTSDASPPRALPKTVARKLFHGLVVALFSPVAATDPVLLALSYAVALALLGVLEVCRAAGGADGLPALGPPLRRFYGRFVDDREGAGDTKAPQLVLTPLYLLAGCAVPHWAALASLGSKAHGVHGSSAGRLPSAEVAAGVSAEVVMRLAGVVALGVGDAAAAVVGFHMGTTRWPGGGNRTLEGSAAALVSMLVAAAGAGAAVAPGWPVIGTVARLVPQLVLPLALVALVEAYATAIDNLVLPLYAAALLIAALHF